MGAMVTINREKIRRFLDDPHQARADAQLVFLFAGHLTGVATHAVFLVKH
jgi:hypothetical protein